MHTDLPADRAKGQLLELKILANRLEEYWDKKLTGKIECYLVVDLAAWPKGSLPDEAVEKLKQRSAVTLTDRVRRGEEVVSIKSKVYANNQIANLHHEVVHAYCWQTFQRCGPDWYAEGMAENFGWDHDRGVGVCYFPWAIKYLRQYQTPPTPSEVISEECANRLLWQTYAYRWALCYVLKNDSQYADRFRDYGRKLLRGEDVDFLRDFADVQQPLADEYRSFLKDIRPGYKLPTRDKSR